MLGRGNSDNPFQGEGSGKGLMGKLGQMGGGGITSSTATGGIRFVIKPSKQACTVLGALTGVMLLACGGVYYLQTNQIADLSTQVEQKEKQLHSSETIARDLRNVTDENTATRNELRFLETSVTQGEYVPTLLHQTQDLAQSTKLHVGALRPQLEPAPPPPPASDKDALKKFVPQPYDKLHVEMDLTGRYWDLALMLYKLTQFPKIMTVDSIEISPSNNAPAPGTVGQALLSVKLRLTGFIFKTDGLTPVPGVPSVPVVAPGAAPGATPLPGTVAAPGAVNAPGAPARYIPPAGVRRVTPAGAPIGTQPGMSTTPGAPAPAVAPVAPKA